LVPAERCIGPGREVLNQAVTGPALTGSVSASAFSFLQALECARAATVASLLLP
jgi:hypothetical protein